MYAFLGHVSAIQCILLKCTMQIHAPECCWVIFQLSVRQSWRRRAVAEHISHCREQQRDKPT